MEKSKLLILIAVFTICHLNLANAQCLPNGIAFTNQSQIDNFPTNYPDCTEIIGSVTISGAINNLNGLSQITTIGNLLHFQSSDLVNLDGLQNLQSVESLFFNNNVNLENIEGLLNLNSVGRLTFGNNSSLLSLAGLENVISLEFELRITGNQELQSLNGLQNITTIGTDFDINLNPQLLNMSGLESLNIIGRNLTIRENQALNNLQGLDNLIQIGGSLTFSINPQLSTIANLVNLTAVEGNFLIQNAPNLANLDGLENLTSIDGSLNIAVNNSLSNIDGIKNIDANSITALQLFQNPNLSDCAVTSICEFLSLDAANIVIDTNAVGCNNKDEVEAACLLGINDNKFSEIKIYPNPTNGNFEISGILEGQIKIIDLQGRKIKEMNIQNDLYSISDIASGIYYLHITSSDGSFIKQIIKR